MFGQFWQDRRGNIAMTFALMGVPIALIAGSAVDFSFVSAQKSNAQAALDAATLAAAKDLGLSSAAQITTKLTTFFNASFRPPARSTVDSLTVTVDTTAGSVSAKADITTRTSFLSIAAIDDITTTVKARVEQGVNAYDVVMVLDNSGSMAGSKLATLKTAAKDLVATLMTMNTVGVKTDRVQIGIVPFAASVNVGASYGPTYSGTTHSSAGTGAAWLDTTTISPIHTENFIAGATDNRFDLFNKLVVANPTYASALRWGGCVETRPYPYDVHDIEPTVTDAKSMFVPMFAPDEPGYRDTTNASNPVWKGSTGFTNNYLDDNGGKCTANSTSTATAAGQLDAQGRTCKYASPTSAQWKTTSFSGSLGPNFSCTSKPIQTMTTNEATLDTAIDALAASGNTNIHEGVMWGWRVLSPGLPFAQGRSTTPEQPLRRIMIVMTDGENTYSSQSNVDASTYGAYGYIAKNRLGTTSTNTAVIKAAQDTRTAEACSNAKTEGNITI